MRLTGICPNSSSNSIYDVPPTHLALKQRLIASVFVIITIVFNHAASDYKCPFCLLVHRLSDGNNDEHDIIFQNKHATALISAKWWVNNPGHAFIIPNQHYENLYEIPDEDLAEVYKVVKQVAIAMRKTYNCEGTSTRQHNEPSGNQHVWHMHVHVFPRYKDDELYSNHNNCRFTNHNERQPYAEMLRKHLAEQHLS